MIGIQLVIYLLPQNYHMQEVLEWKKSQAIYLVMEKCYDLPVQKFMLSIFLVFFAGLFTISVQAQQTARPFSIELNAGGGLIGNSATDTAFQPEIGVSYMPGSWGVGLNAGLYSFGSGFSAEQYRTGYEEYTIAEQNSDQWNAISINAGPRFQKSLSRFISLNLGLDLAMNYQEGPSQSVRFNDPSGELESSGVDTDIVLAQMDGEGAAGWNTAIRPQLQLEFQPGFSDRFSFNVKTGIQHHLSDREITYTERDLSRIMQVDSPFEMHFQFENAPVVQRTESAPRTNFFANAGIKISFGGSRAPAQDYNAARSNKPTSRAEDIGDGDLDSDDDGIDDAVETAQDYNSSRSNKPSTEIADDDWDRNNEIIRNAVVMARMANPTGVIISAGPVKMTSHHDSPIYEGDAVGGENALAKTEANDSSEDDFNSAGVNSPIYEMADVGGDGEGDNNINPLSTKRYDMQPNSYCVSLSGTSDQVLKTFFQTGDKPSSIAQDTGEGDLDSDATAMATSHNASRSNRSQGISNQGGDTDIEADSTDISPATSHNASRSNRSQGITDQGNDSWDGTNQDSTSGNRAIPPKIHGIAVDDPANLKPNTDQNGFPEIMKNASFSISKRSARTGRSQNPIHEEGGNMQSNPMYESEEMASGNGGEIDGYADGFHLVLEIDDMRSRVSEVISDMDSDSPTSRADSSNNANAPPGVQLAPSQTKVIVLGVTDNGDIIPLEESKLIEFEFNGDPDSDDDGLMDAIDSATYSISKRSARTGRNASSEGNETGKEEWDEGTDERMVSDDDPCGPGVWARTSGGSENCSPEISGQENPLSKESEWQEAPNLEVSPPNDVYQWTYNLSELEGGGDLPADGTLTVLFSGGNWHFDVQIDPLDPDDDGDGIIESLQNSSFSISKRSARM